MSFTKKTMNKGKTFQYGIVKVTSYVQNEQTVFCIYF